jgi:hypothetical protein
MVEARNLEIEGLQGRSSERTMSNVWRVIRWEVYLLVRSETRHWKINFKCKKVYVCTNKLPIKRKSVVLTDS